MAPVVVVTLSHTTVQLLIQQISCRKEIDDRENIWQLNATAMIEASKTT